MLRQERERAQAFRERGGVAFARMLREVFGEDGEVVDEQVVEGARQRAARPRSRE